MRPNTHRITRFYFYNDYLAKKVIGNDELFS